MKKNIIKIFILVIISTFLFSCNPFAPDKEDFDNSQSIGDLSTIHGVMNSFAYAYAHKDSFLYKNLLADDFLFEYDNNGNPESWNKDEDIKITNRLFNSFKRINLVFNGDFPNTENGQNDTTIITSFQLSLSSGADEETFTGQARFSYRKLEEKGDDRNDPIYQIYYWEDLK